MKFCSITCKDANRRHVEAPDERDMEDRREVGREVLIGLSEDLWTWERQGFKL